MPYQTFPNIAPDNKTSSNTKQVAVVRTQFGDGYSQRAADGINSLRETWKLSWANLTNTEEQTINAFLTARKGVEAFLWKSPDEPGDPKLWSCQEWGRTPQDAGVQNFEATFIQEFDIQS